MLVIVYHRLWQGTSDEEQRDADHRPKQEERDRKRAIKALEHLGYRVTVDCLERVMYSRGSTDGTRRMVVIPAHAGIQEGLRIWIPAYAGMTCPRSIPAHSIACNMHNTL